MDSEELKKRTKEFAHRCVWIGDRRLMIVDRTKNAFFSARKIGNGFQGIEAEN